MSSPLEIANTDLAEEIEAINAIYDPNTITISSSTTSPKATTTIKLQIPNHPHLSFLLAFEPTYPESLPKILGTASTASRGEGKIAIDVLEDILGRTSQPGAVCLFDVINEATEAFEELSIGGASANTEETTITTSTTLGNTSTTNDNGQNDLTPLETSLASLSLHETFGLDAPPPWILSEVVTEKKSVFVGRAAHVTSLDQAQAYLDYLLASDKKVASATHNISAWRIRQKKPSPGLKDNSPAEMIIQDCDDDGETAAGGRLLHLMQLMDVWDVVVVVTRWYGGIHLGPDRFRIINAVGRDALVRGGFGKDKEKVGQNGSGEKGKKKGKR
ncbi:ribosomal protein S5 domain 2-type protein [Aspergillus pseudoustus]|uniref:Ribosomal protein S5 domain 2-type protein n=1 Tax=Aspergillus pseudoustus TaxID=1810923 RepID=A0ABR4JVR5_9EURO